MAGYPRGLEHIFEYIWNRKILGLVWGLNPGHLGGRRVLYPLLGREHSNLFQITLVENIIRMFPHSIGTKAKKKFFVRLSRVSNKTLKVSVHQKPSDFMSIVHQNVFMTIIFLHNNKKQTNKQTNREWREMKGRTFAEIMSLIEPIRQGNI